MVILRLLPNNLANSGLFKIFPVIKIKAKIILAIVGLILMNVSSHEKTVKLPKMVKTIPDIKAILEIFLLIR